MSLDWSGEIKKRIATTIRMMSERTSGSTTAVTDSDDSSNGSDHGEFIPYNERPEWSDVTPVPQEDGPNPVAAIKYTDKFRNTFDYFRAVLKSDERSERAFKLTTACATLNPANYTVWYYRRILLKDLKKDIPQELDYIENVISDHPKNYQVWHHRKVLVEWNGHPQDEKRFTERILDMDAKNYHAWQHRQWFLGHFKNYENEVEFTESLIRADVRNNSAWNHRFFVLERSTGFTPEVIDHEVDFTLKKITLAPNNESPWNYLRGILEKPGLNSSRVVEEFCRKLYSPPSECRSPHLLGFMIDAIQEKLELSPNEDELVKTALTFCNELANRHDTIRKNYWTYVHDQLEEKFGKPK